MISTGRRCKVFLIPSIAVFAVFFVLPLSYFFVISFWRVRLYKLTPDFTFENYVTFYEEYLYPAVFTFAIALSIAVLTTLLAFGFAYFVRFRAGRFGPVFLFIALITMFGGYLVKIYAWKTILGTQGIINTGLLASGVIEEPIPWLLYNPSSVVVTLTHFLLPFAILPIYGSLRSISNVELEAARDLAAQAPAGAGRYCSSPVPIGHSGRVYAHLSHICGRLRHATARGRPIHLDDRYFRRVAVRQPFERTPGFRSCRGHIIHLSVRAASLPLHHARRITSAMTGLSKTIWGGFGVLVVIFMLSPLVLVVLFSFGENEHATLPMGGVTLGWYRTLFASRDFLVALKNSAIITGSVGVASAVIGTLAALALARLPMRRAGLMIMALSLPIMMPALVLALALLSAYAALGFRLGIETVIPSQLVFTQPFVILIVYARMVSFDDAMIEGARDLGASPFRAFFTVTLPIVRPTIIGAALIAMALSLDDFIITYFTIGGGLTLPTMVWGMLRTSLDPDINALATLIIAFTISSTVIALWVTRYRG